MQLREGAIHRGLIIRPNRIVEIVNDRTTFLSKQPFEERRPNQRSFTVDDYRVIFPRFAYYPGSPRKIVECPRRLPSDVTGIIEDFRQARRFKGHQVKTDA